MSDQPNVAGRERAGRLGAYLLGLDFHEALKAFSQGFGEECDACTAFDHDSERFNVFDKGCWRTRGEELIHGALFGDFREGASEAEPGCVGIELECAGGEEFVLKGVEALGEEVPGVGSSHAKGEVCVTSGEADDLIGDEEAQLNLGEVSSEAWELGAEHPAKNLTDGCKDDLALGLGKIIEDRLGGEGGVDHRTHRLKQGFASVREANGIFSEEQGGARFVFELLKLSADGRLADSESFGGRGQAAEASDQFEGSECVPVHKPQPHAKTDIGYAFLAIEFRLCISQDGFIKLRKRL